MGRVLNFVLSQNLYRRPIFFPATHGVRSHLIVGQPVGPIDHKHRVCIFLDGHITLDVRSVGSKEQGRQGTCDMWRIRVTMVPVETQQCFLCIVEQNHCQQFTDNECCTEVLLWQIYVVSNKKLI
jgi:hypothetical protein